MRNLCVDNVLLHLPEEVYKYGLWRSVVTPFIEEFIHYDYFASFLYVVDIKIHRGIMYLLLQGKTTFK